MHVQVEGVDFHSLIIILKGGTPLPSLVNKLLLKDLVFGSPLYINNNPIQTFRSNTNSLLHLSREVASSGWPLTFLVQIFTVPWTTGINKTIYHYLQSLNHRWPQLRIIYTQVGKRSTKNNDTAGQRCGPILLHVHVQ